VLNLFGIPAVAAFGDAAGIDNGNSGRVMTITCDLITEKPYLAD
jgi:hypothetical protein